MLKIGNIEIENPLILAPMAGITDLPFRMLCKEQGCGLVYTEMVSAKAIYHNNKNTNVLLKIEPAEKPVSLQFFGNDPYIMSEMAKKIEALDFDILDINMGCPVPKVVNNGEGSALMKDPQLAGRIVEAIVKAIKKPVTVKIRKGFTCDTINAVEMAKIVEASGASAVAVHGRTRSQYYSGQADWGIIREVKESVSIPVIGNGDVTSPETAQALLEQTGCDGIMIGRRIQGNPWLFKEILHYMKHGEKMARPSIEAIIEMTLRHARAQAAYKGDYLGIREMRKHVAWYTTGMPGSAKLRSTVNQIESYPALETLLYEYAENLKKTGI